jgi:hypothetical protein
LRRDLEKFGIYSQGRTLSSGRRFIYGWIKFSGIGLQQMINITLTKPIIIGNGIDKTTATIVSDAKTNTYILDGQSFTVDFDAVVADVYTHDVIIMCDSPAMPIILSCGLAQVTIYAVQP